MLYADVTGPSEDVREGVRKEVGKLYMTSTHPKIDTMFETILEADDVFQVRSDLCRYLCSSLRTLQQLAR